MVALYDRTFAGPLWEQGRFHILSVVAGNPLDVTVRGMTAIQQNIWMVDDMDKQTFWDKVICLQGGVRRFVAKKDFAKNARVRETKPNQEGAYSGSADDEDDFVPYAIFLPETPDDDFNLVLSLANDGAHYPLYDLDLLNYKTTKWKKSGRNLVTYVQHRGSQTELKIPLPPTGETTITPSTSGNTHVWSSRRCSWETYLEQLAQVPGEDAAAFRKAVTIKGFGGLRPPWVVKLPEEVVSEKKKIVLPDTLEELKL